MDRGYFPVTPDLLYEVVAPGDEAEDLEQKLDEYREAGIPLIWVIYPGTRRVQVLGANRPRVELEPTGVLDGADVLPGFTCSLQELFASAEPEK